MNVVKIREQLTRATTFLVVAALTTSDLRASSPIPESSFPISISSRHGYIRDYFNPKQEKAPAFVLIENLHQNRSAQRSIERVLEDLRRQGLLPETLALEGFSGSFDMSEMQSMGSMSARRNAASYLISQGEMTGALAYVAAQGSGKVFGVEEPNLLRSAITMFQRSYQSRLRLLEEVDCMGEAVHRLSHRPVAVSGALLAEDLHALRQLASLEVTPQEVRKVVTRARSAMNRLSGLLPAKDLNEMLWPVSALINYYTLALMRDDALFERSLLLRARENQSTSVLVAGGFHTEGVTRALRAKKLSFIVVSPVITRHDEIDESLYVSRMMGRHITIQQASEGLNWVSTQGTEPPPSPMLPRMFRARMRAGRLVLLVGLLFSTVAAKPYQEPVQVVATSKFSDSADEMIRLALTQQDVSAIPLVPNVQPDQLRQWMNDLRELNDSTRREAAIQAFIRLNNPSLIPLLIKDAYTESLTSATFGHHILAALRIIAPIARGEDAKAFALVTMKNVSNGLRYPKDTRSPPDIALARAAAEVLAKLVKDDPAMIDRDVIYRLLKLMQAEMLRRADPAKFGEEPINDAAERGLKAIGNRRIMRYFDSEIRPYWTRYQTSQDTQILVNEHMLEGLDAFKEISFTGWLIWNSYHILPVWSWLLVLPFLAMVSILIINSFNPIVQVQAQLDLRRPIGENLGDLIKRIGKTKFLELVERASEPNDLFGEGLPASTRLLNRVINTPEKMDKFIKLVEDVGVSANDILIALAGLSEKIDTYEKFEAYVRALNHVSFTEFFFLRSNVLTRRAIPNLINEIQRPQDVYRWSLLSLGLSRAREKLIEPSIEIIKHEGGLQEYATNSGTSASEGIVGDEERVVDPDRWVREDIEAAARRINSGTIIWKVAQKRTIKGEGPTVTTAPAEDLMIPESNNGLSAFLALPFISQLSADKISYSGSGVALAAGLDPMWPGILVGGLLGFALAGYWKRGFDKQVRWLMVVSAASIIAATGVVLGAGAAVLSFVSLSVAIAFVAIVRKIAISSSIRQLDSRAEATRESRVNYYRAAFVPLFSSLKERSAQLKLAIPESWQSLTDKWLSNTSLRKQIADKRSRYFNVAA